LIPLKHFELHRNIAEIFGAKHTSHPPAIETIEDSLPRSDVIVVTPHITTTSLTESQSSVTCLDGNSLARLRKHLIFL